MGEPSDNSKWEGGEVVFTGGTDWAMVCTRLFLALSPASCPGSMIDPAHDICSWDALVARAKLMRR